METKDERNLRISTKYVNGLDANGIEKLKADLRTLGYTDVDTKEDLINRYNLWINDPATKASAGFIMIVGIVAVALIIMVLVSMFQNKY